MVWGTCRPLQKGDFKKSEYDYFKKIFGKKADSYL